MWKILCRIISVPHNTVMDMNNTWSYWVKITLINRPLLVFRLLSFSIMESHALLVRLYHPNMTSFACAYFMTADLLNLRPTDITTSLDTQVSIVFDKIVAMGSHIWSHFNYNRHWNSGSSNSSSTSEAQVWLF